MISLFTDASELFTTKIKETHIRLVLGSPVKKLEKKP
jgi:hypothetical protein